MSGIDPFDDDGDDNTNVLPLPLPTIAIVSRNRSPVIDNDIASHLLQDITVNADGVRPVYTKGMLWTYVTGVWIPTEVIELKKRVQHYHRTVEIASEVTAISRRIRDDAVDILLTEIGDETFFDQATRGTAFNDCFCQIEADGTVAIMPHRPDHRATAAFDFNYEKDCEPTSFLHFLNEIFLHDADKEARIELLRQFIGMCCLKAATQLERCLLLLGSGSNGKSVLLEIISSLFQSENVTAVEPHTFGDEKRAAMLVNSNINIFHEVPARAIKDSTALKSVISGQPIAARFMRQDPFRFRPTAGHIFSCNELPKTNDTSPAFWRRFLVINLTRTFDGSTLATAIRAPIENERAKIVSWAIEGASMALKQGKYTIPTSSVEIHNNWAKAVDSAVYFVREMTDPAGETSATTAHTRYCLWCDQQGLEPVDMRKFAVQARLVGKGSKRTRKGMVYEWTCKSNVPADPTEKTKAEPVDMAALVSED